MSKKTGLIIVAFLIIFIVIRVNFALNYSTQNQSSEAAEPFSPELPVSFTGTLPCASCPGISYELRLEENQSFTEFSRYLDRDPGDFVYTGRWSAAEDSLTLHFDHSDDIKQFLYADETLKLLDSEGETITGELEDHYELQKNDEFRSILNLHRELRTEGVTFVANGNEPFWSYRILENNTLEYAAPGEEQISRSIQKENNEEGFELTAELSSGLILESIVEEKFCKDTMSGFRFSHTVTITLGEETHSGCGRFLR
ncbi:hypothetical protein DYD21_07720 [Rhodohalobacter sp. SW132]|uniref:copper resistance protein NlpE N-terminal domain-containing protein n=1 Tax=Rhodohalobacter sp. SW132 TaxID=2293433 RepID=UPI000E26DA93|nr:copper resistance protein NlpE N-terminal domain-containing protein [Rhodohalobacter sp. SW132]REL37663.1 hypothetical protein DYD21_07720 [Rhodohalobacter sp. SW132]